MTKIDQVDISWYKTIFEFSQESITVTDLSGKILVANKSALKMFGYSFEELRQMNISDFYISKNKRSEMLSQLRKQGYLKDYSLQLIPKSGEITEITCNFNPIFNSTGEIVAIHANFIDQSAKKLAEKSLKASEARYRNLVENAPEAITVVDVESLKFIDCNENATKLFKISREELLQLGPVELSPKIQPNGEYSIEMAKAKINGAFQGQKPIFEWIHLDSKGNEIPCEIWLSRLPHNEKEIVRGSIIDISEKKKAEQILKQSQIELIQAQKMEALGRLTGGIAHDINNTLTAILGYTSLLHLELDGNDKLIKMIDEIEKAGIKSSQMIKQLMAFSRKEDLRFEPINLNEIIRDTKNLLKSLIGADIQFITTLDENIGLVMADPIQITQMLMNLAINAREAMLSGGRVEISTYDYVKLKAEEGEERCVILYFSDDGIGMDDEVKNRLFEPFFTTKTTGTGLGLSSVYGLVENAGASIKVDSQSGKGTTFEISFPVTGIEPQEFSTPIYETRPELFTGKQVLIVEDEDQVRRLIEQMLKDEGMHVKSSQSPSEAIELIQSNQFDLLISDIIMPEMSGIEMTKKLAKQKGLRIFFMTGYLNQPQYHEVMKLNYPIIHKPFTKENLLRMITRVLSDPPHRTQHLPSHT